MAKKKTKNTLTYDTLPALFTGICDAIRSKTGGIELIDHQSIPDQIANLPSGGAVLTPVMYNCKASNNTATSYTYTVTKNGSIYVTITGSYVGSDTSSVSLNGTTVTPTQSKIASGSRTAIVKVYVIEVTSGDTITVTLNTSASYFEGGCSIFE